MYIDSSPLNVFAACRASPSDTLFKMGIALKKDSGQAGMTSLKLFTEQ
jgi:hypothetical protein